MYIYSYINRFLTTACPGVTLHSKGDWELQQNLAILSANSLLLFLFIFFFIFTISICLTVVVYVIKYGRAFLF